MTTATSYRLATSMMAAFAVFTLWTSTLVVPAAADTAATEASAQFRP